jgi:dipeptidyl aminopeptidase/acylaminoacyl peptidase
VSGAPHGSWRSPITASAIVGGAATIPEVVVDGDDVWWLEQRPAEGGRGAIVRRDAGGSVVEVTPPDANVRTRVHEYGGGAWWVQGGVLVYVDASDGRLRRLAGGPPTVLCDAPGDRFADGRFSPDGQWYVCVRERHRPAAPEPANELVAVATDGTGRVEVLVSGPDFVANPRPSPDGTRLAWLQWNHPDMPWDATELWVASLHDGVASDARRLAGGSGEALMQPEWSPACELHVISDRTGWSNLYRVDGQHLTDVRTGAFDIGLPPWVFGTSAYAFCGDGRVVIDVDVRDVLSDPVCLRARGDRVVVAGATWGEESQVVELAADGSHRVLRPPRDLGLDPGFLPAPEPITFPTTGRDEVAHAWFYRPANPHERAPHGDRPPLIVVAHSGPTGAARRSLHLPLRYWTSRGFAVVDVDYRGSTGYGRSYRRALEGRWGIADVDDCVAAGRFLVERGDVDGARLAIRGSSAGGFTVLRALTSHEVFAAGASAYGIADLEALVRESHKFEARYFDRLIGPYPERRDLYVERSPIHHSERLRTPMIVLQGLDDRIVPPEQAEMLVGALRSNGVPFAYLAFPGEGHGFRGAETIILALEAELSFYAQRFGFVPADPIDPVPIEGRPGTAAPG